VLLLLLVSSRPVWGGEQGVEGGGRRGGGVGEVGVGVEEKRRGGVLVLAYSRVC
jgi:hypothetical protein